MQLFCHYLFFISPSLVPWEGCVWHFLGIVTYIFGTASTRKAYIKAFCIIGKAWARKPRSRIFVSLGQPGQQKPRSRHFLSLGQSGPRKPRPRFFVSLGQPGQGKHRSRLSLPRLPQRFNFVCHGP